jgi:hypothetical protein
VQLPLGPRGEFSVERVHNTVRKSEPREPIVLQLNGRTFAGSYTLSSGMVHVVSLYGGKSVQFCGTPPNLLAQRILRENIQEAGTAGALR